MPRKQTSPEISTLAAEALADPKASPREKSLAASALSQDETAGQSPMTEAEARDLFPGEQLEFYTVASNRDGTPKIRSMAATWAHAGVGMRQSMLIPPGEHGIGKAAHMLRDLIDLMKEATE